MGGRNLVVSLTNIQMRHRLLPPQLVAYNREGKEVACSKDFREGLKVPFNEQLTSGNERNCVGLIFGDITEIGRISSEGPSAISPVRGGGIIYATTSQGVVSPGMTTRSGSSKLNGSGRRPPTAPTYS